MRILVVNPIHEQGINILKECGEVVFPSSTNQEDLLAISHDCDAILVRTTKINRELIEKSPKLKVIARHGVGVDNIDLEAATEKNIQVVNAPFSNLNAVAEHAVMLILNLLRQTEPLNAATKSNNYAKCREKIVLKEVTQKKIGFVGFGKIPQRVKELLTAFNPSFLAYDPYAQGQKWQDVKFCQNLNELFSQCDIISIHLPLTPQTTNLINLNILSACTNKPYLVNTARGGIVNEQDLIKALDTGLISGYGTDVFEHEPPQDNDPMIIHPLVLCSPHCAALTDHALINMATDAAKGLKDVLNGQKPQYPVNKI